MQRRDFVKFSLLAPIAVWFGAKDSEPVEDVVETHIKCTFNGKTFYVKSATVTEDGPVVNLVPKSIQYVEGGNLPVKEA